MPLSLSVRPGAAAAGVEAAAGLGGEPACTVVAAGCSSACSSSGTPSRSMA